MKLPELNNNVSKVLNEGVVIPAFPLALDKNRKLDEHRQRALARYYLDAGAGGIAVAVHTTQFEIRSPKIELFRPVIEIAKEELDRFMARTNKTIIRIAGITGKTEQAVREAGLVSDLGYDAGLLSLSAFAEASNEEILQHCRNIAEIIPLIGFYLQPAVGGRKLDVDFWRDFSGIENVVAIKIAPFNRYQTLDVIRGVAESGRADKIALYTGNDDNIVADLLTEYRFKAGSEIIRKRIVGGLLGHWAVWTKKAVDLLNEIHKVSSVNEFDNLLSTGIQITDCNAAFFDVINNFKGCIVGLHEVLRRQGLLEGLWTLNKNEILSPAQKAEIDRVYLAYPELNDDDFVAKNLDEWLK
ncbi:MAG: dihydrodipicolinate synthase family protein [Chlorobi bacterium]|nr:dihydrodipicolinate synthase family protein [Chlorobiota bacterium]